jgi:hypothetical protein
MAQILNKDILDEIQEMRRDTDKRLRDIEITSSETRSKVEVMNMTVNRLDKVVIVGNGTKPMQERLNNVEDYIKVLKDCDADKKDTTKKTRLLWLGAGISFTVVNIGGLIITYIKLLPSLIK